MMRSISVAMCFTVLLLGACQRQSARTNTQTDVVIAIPGDVVSFDPANNISAFDGALLDLTYQQLTGVDATSSNGALVGELADHWTISPDHLTWTFTLRDRQRFDDGTPVTADAVKTSFDRIRVVSRNPESLFWLQSVQILDQKTVQLHLTRPFAAVAAYLALPQFSIVNPRAVAQHRNGDDHATAWLSEHTAGSGSYKLQQWRRGQDLSLIANTASSLPPKQFTRVHLNIVLNDATRRLQLQNGDVDYVGGLGAAAARQYATLPHVTIQRANSTLEMRFLTINTERPALRDKRVRQAIAAAIDYHALQAQILAGNVGLINGFLPANVPGGDPSLPPPHRDLARARELLREAGYNPATQLQLVVGGYGPVAEFLQSQLQEAGINVRLQRQAPSAIEATRATGAFDLYYDGWTMDVPDPAIFFNLAFSSRYRGSGVNASRYSTPALDAALDAALGEPDQARRAAEYRAIETQLMDAQPVVMLYATLPIAAYRSDLANVRVNPYQTTYMNIADWTRRP